MITLLTVVYSGEIKLFELQAISINKFFNISQVEDIYIIINEEDDADLVYSHVLKIVEKNYSNFLSKVRIFRQSDLITLNSDYSGWRSQQYLKLKGSSFTNAEYVLILDSKNHFIKPVSIENYVSDSSGKMISFHENRGLNEKYLLPTLNLFDINQEKVFATLPCITPYITRPELIQSTIHYVENLKGVSFEKFFLSIDRMSTEFFMLFAYLFKFGLIDKYYEVRQRASQVTFFTEWPETSEKLEWALNRLHSEDVICFGIHKDRLPKIDESIKSEIIKVWTKNELFSSPTLAENYLNELIGYKF